jgi:predicted nucleic acid-binding protein
VSLRASAKVTPGRIVLDAGTLIALFHSQDPDHGNATRGFAALADRHAELVTPAPVVFEVYKWLLYHADYAVAQIGLREVRATAAITCVEAEEFDLASEITNSLQGWTGTLEDAVVALTALRLRAPVWTLNYRDLSAFPRLIFWNP